MLREVVWIFVVLCSMPVFSTDTELSLYRPLTETTKQLPTVIADKKSGECWQQSQLIKREDAWRCIAEGHVYDPCFVRRFGTHLEAVCVESPWSSKGVQLSVTTPLNNNQHETLDMSRTFPWAVELTNGQRCQAIESSAQYDGLTVHYRCDENKELIGDLQRCNSAWKILQHTSNGIETVTIARAWF